jgi:protoheme IX farnesyltransferase
MDQKTASIVTTKLRLYWPLIKSLQTGLLLSTGIAGFLSAHVTVRLSQLLGLSASLFLAISGSTILNMWYDCDIDARMERTHKRPAASGRPLLSRQTLYRIFPALLLLMTAAFVAGFALA